MPATQQIEATIDAMIAKLNAELPAKITEINAELTDEWTLTGPAGISFGQRSETAFPWIAVLPARTVKVTDASGAIVRKHQIDVVPWVEAWQEDGISRLITRYIRAVDEVLLRSRQPGTALGAGGYGLEFLEDFYGPVFAQPGDQQGVTTWGRARYAIRQEQYIG
jgi:hypothetical protein